MMDECIVNVVFVLFGGYFSDDVLVAEGIIVTSVSES